MELHRRDTARRASLLSIACLLGVACADASGTRAETDGASGGGGASAGVRTGGEASIGSAGVLGGTSASGAPSSDGQGGASPTQEPPSLSWNECLAYRGDSKFLTCKTSGGAISDETFRDTDVYRHDQLCGGTWRQDGVLRLRLYVWATGNYEMVWSLDAEGLAPGELGSSRALEVRVEQYYGHLWIARDVCTLEITSNERLAHERAYAITARLSCPEPVPDRNWSVALLIERFEFSVAIDARP